MVVLLLVLFSGTAGIKLLTGWDWVEAFYFMAMIATTEGPPVEPPTMAAKLFAAAYAFLSVATLLTVLSAILGPLAAYLVQRGLRHAQRELEMLEKRVKETPG